MNFEIDEKATIRSILKALRTEGVKTGDVAKAIPGISEKPFRNALKAAGWEFSNQAPKGWHFVGEGEKPLDKSIFDFVNKSSSPKKTNKKVTTGDKYPTPDKINFTDSNIGFTPSNTNDIPNSPIVHEQFTQEEVKMIKEMLKSWQQFAPQGEPQGEPYGGHYALKVDVTPLHDRIKALPQGDKTRKTIVIDKGIAERLDGFCKAERVNKSDILHLALMDFLDKVEK